MDEQQITAPPESIPPVDETQAVVTAEPAPSYFGNERQIAYTITDGFFPDFQVYESANAWWMDRRKVELLIEGYKRGMAVEQARVYAGVTRGQYDYFIEIHPDFPDIKAACLQQPFLKAFETLEKDMQNPQTAKWYLEKRHPLFGNRVKVESDEPLVRNTNININDGIDSGKVEETVARVLTRVGLERAGSGDGSHTDAGQPEEVHPD
jgi:hypothetical protein